MATPPMGGSASTHGRVSIDPFPAGGSYEDDFESYPLGEICGQNGWDEWEGSEDVCGSVTDEEANSGTQSLKIVGAVGGDLGLGDDTVQTFDATGGQWTFSIMTFVPEDAQGEAGVFLLNTYPATLNAHWSIVVDLNVGLGVVENFTGEIAVIQKGVWVELRYEIDLENDLVDIFYDGEEFVSDQSWTAGIDVGGAAAISALDLYGYEPGAGTTGTYFDDIKLLPAGGGCPADCDGNGVLNILDFVCFQGEWQNQTDLGDCDGNGLYNILDFVCYQGEFTQGCP
jgi:hypothetical protein